MDKKTNALVVGCLGGASTIATAIVTFCVPAATAALIVGAIGIATTAAIEIINIFTTK